nr:hypothetical protein [Tanacetum cinerariifolium]
ELKHLFPSESEVDRLPAIPTLPPSPLTLLSSPLQRIPLPPFPVPSPLPTNPIDARVPLGYRDAMIRLRAELLFTSHPLSLPPPIVLPHTRVSMVMMRAAAPSTYILAPRSETPPSGTPPLLPIPLPTSSPHLLLPSTDYRSDVHEVTLPPLKRLCIALGLRFEVREISSAPTARPTRGFRVDYGFVGTLDAEIRRDPDREIGSLRVIVLGYDGLPMIPEEPYAYVESAMQEPPLPDFVPELVYLEFMPPEDDVLPAEEQPVPARLCIALGPRFKVGECSSAPTAGPTGGFRADYGFFGTLDAKIRRNPEREIDFVTTIRQDTNEIYGRLDDAQDDRLLISGQLNSLCSDRRSHARKARLMESETKASREAWVQSMDASDTTRYEKMAPTRRTTRASLATKTTTTHVTNAQLKAPIDQGDANALVARDADRSQNGVCFPKSLIKLKKYVNGLPDMIHGSVMVSKLNTRQDAVEFATEQMDKKICTFAERQTKNKRKSEDTFRNNQNTGRAYTARHREKNPYGGI